MTSLGHCHPRVTGAIREAGGMAVFVGCDLASEAECEQLVATTVERFGALTILVNNAVSPEAIARDSRVAQMDTAVWRQMFEVNLLAPAVLCREAIPHMLRGGRGSRSSSSSMPRTIRLRSS